MVDRIATRKVWRGWFACFGLGPIRWRWMSFGLGCGLASFSAIAASILPVQASGTLPSPAPSPVRTATHPEADYWHAARRQLGERIYILTDIREALLLPDPEAIAEIDFPLYHNQLTTRRFLRLHTVDFALQNGQCPSSGERSDNPRLALQCVLAATQNDIDALFDPLLEQQTAIADLPPSAFLPDANASDRQRVPHRQDLDAANELPGIAAKAPQARTARPSIRISPAYSPPPDLIDRIDALSATLIEASALLPREFAIALPEERFTAIPQAAPMAVPMTASPAIAQSSDEIPSRTREPYNPTENRILATGLPYLPLITAAPQTTVPGLPNALADTFVPSLLLEIAGDLLEVVALDFDYGAIVELDNLDTTDAIDFDALTLETALDRLAPAQRAVFSDYRPPNTFAELHADRQRARLGKNDAFGVSAGVATSLPAIADRVYLFRTIQYDLPDFIETGRALYPAEQRDLAAALETPSFDATIAVQLQAPTPDGGYTIRWQLLERFPDPQILDLYNYMGDRRGRTAR